VVLPFENLSGEDDYFSRGFVDDLITDLSRFPELFVIAPRSSTDERVSELSVDYVLKGSIRRDPQTLRVTTQLVTPDDGRIAWADRYDAPVDQILQVQDQITAEVTGRLANRINTGRLAASRRKKTSELAAHDLWLQGYDRLKEGSLAADRKARTLFSRALEADPTYARAVLGLSLSHFNEWSCQLWGQWTENETAAFEYAQRAAELDANDHYTQMVLGRVLLFRREFELASMHIERSLALNENDADCLVQAAMTQAYLGDAERAEVLFSRALRLNPYHDAWYYAFGMIVAFARGQWAQVIERGERCGIEVMVDLAGYLAASYLQLGDEAQAARYAALYLEQFALKIATGRQPEPGEALRWIAHVNAYRDDQQMARLVDGLMRAAALEGEPLAPAAQPANRCAFRRVGSLWQVSYAGRDTHLPHAKGLSDIGTLLQRPGDEVHAAELMGVTDATGGDDQMDPQARAQYRARMAELREELAQAEDDSDLGRTEALHSELDALVEHVGKSLGLGGRSRKLGAPAERARSAVTQRIRGAIKRIAASHPDLGKHLENAIRTGQFCTYSPEKPVDWQL